MGIPFYLEVRENSMTFQLLKQKDIALNIEKVVNVCPIFQI